MTESPGDGLKRMRMRAWRRGTREMDLILGPFAEARLEGLSAGDRRIFDALLDQNDHDLYGWITGAAPAPAPFAPLLAVISQAALGRIAQGRGA